MTHALARTALAFALACLPCYAVQRALGPVVERLTMPACQIEDGSSGPLPCRWDAQHSGNGQGRSFTIEPLADGGRVFRYDDGRVHVEDSDVDPCLLDDQCNPWLPDPS